jgi:MFS family permease
MIPVLIGPIIGPLIGGCLAQAFGWRSTFVALAAFSAAAFLGLLLVLRKVSFLGTRAGPAAAGDCSGFGLLWSCPDKRQTGIGPQGHRPVTCGGVCRW